LIFFIFLKILIHFSTDWISWNILDHLESCSFKSEHNCTNTCTISNFCIDNKLNFFLDMKLYGGWFLLCCILHPGHRAKTWKYNTRTTLWYFHVFIWRLVTFCTLSVFLWHKSPTKKLVYKVIQVQETIYTMNSL
jgi:hypothetical protein